MGPRSSSSSQIHRHWCRSAQLKTRLFLLAHRLVNVQKTSRCEKVRIENWHERCRVGSSFTVSKKVRWEEISLHNIFFNYLPGIMYLWLWALTSSFQSWSFAASVSHSTSHGTATSSDTCSAYISYGASTPSATCGDIVRSTRKLDTINLRFKIIYDNLHWCRKISPTDSYFMGFFGFGEGWHNYHVSLLFNEICQQDVNQC